jgi:hypothetical protein
VRCPPIRTRDERRLDRCRSGRGIEPATAGSAPSDVERRATVMELDLEHAGETFTILDGLRRMPTSSLLGCS